MDKLVRESIIFEKFAEGPSDPIADMGISGYSFDALRKGAIITAQVPKLSLKRNDDGYFTYYGKGIDLPIDYPLLVESVRDYILPGTKEIKICKADKDIEEVKKARENLRTEDRVKGYYVTHTRMIITKKKFDKMFKVLLSGF